MQTIALPTFNTPRKRRVKLKPYPTRHEAQAAEMDKLNAWRAEEARKQIWLEFPGLRHLFKRAA